MLETQPGAAVVGLKRSALGVRFLLGRWERLLRLMNDEGTLYGADRNEFINYQGAQVTAPEDLFHSEGAYLTWVYCLMCQPAPKDEHFVAMGNPRWMPTGLMDRKGPSTGWVRPPLCRSSSGSSSSVSSRSCGRAKSCCGCTTRRRLGTAPRSASRCLRVHSAPSWCGWGDPPASVLPRLPGVHEGACPERQDRCAAGCSRSEASRRTGRYQRIRARAGVRRGVGRGAAPTAEAGGRCARARPGERHRPADPPV